MQNASKPVSGLTNVINTIVSPKEAFEALRETPTWGWAIVITILTAIVAGFLLHSTYLHAFDAGWPAQVAASPSMAGMSQVQLDSSKHIGETVIGLIPIFSIIFVPLFVLIEAVIMLIFNAAGKGSATFKSLWAVQANIAIPAAAIAAIINAIIVLVRGSDSFPSVASIQAATPTLALLAPHAGKLTNFLTAFTPFSIWGAILVGLAMITTAKTSKGIAWAAAITSMVIPALLTLAGPGAK